MDVTVLEGIAIAAYERVGLDPGEPTSTHALARRILGPGAFARLDRMNAPAALFWLKGQRRIAVRKGVPIEYAQFYVGHELGHLLLEDGGYREDDLEAACDYLGGALMAPRPAMRSLRIAFGADYEGIAGAVCATQTWAALRFAEVTGIPTAVVAPKSVRVRGEEWGWPQGEAMMRRFAKMPALPGMRRARLRDDPRRVVLAVEDAEVA